MDGPHRRASDSLTAKCDGYSDYGSLLDNTRVLRVAIDLFPAPGSKDQKSETVILNFDRLTVNEIADFTNGASKSLMENIERAAARQKYDFTNRKIFNLVAIEIEIDTQRDGVLRDRDGMPLVRQDAYAQTPVEVRKRLGVEGTPFGAEIGCIDQMQKLPSASIQTAVQGVIKGRAAAVIAGRDAGKSNVDIVVVPEGLLFNEYPKGLRGTESEHFVEIPALSEGQGPIAYYHSLTDDSWHNAFFDKPPYQNYRPKLVKLEAKNIVTSRKSQGYQFLLKALLEKTRDYRREADRNPRYRSLENLTLLRNALNACSEVPGLTNANNGELSFFENYIYRNLPARFPEQTSASETKIPPYDFTMDLGITADRE